MGPFLKIFVAYVSLNDLEKSHISTGVLLIVVARIIFEHEAPVTKKLLRLVHLQNDTQIGFFDRMFY